ncbi:sel1 repeat family protein [Akkermansiaceae bacterium]|nr:sel1 repeat family protein [bacterium]MDB4481935.1 sel1 repeat family protein [Akkermansiaceae bacterium]
MLTGLGLFLRFYIYAINLVPVEELLGEDAITEDGITEAERRKLDMRKDVKKLLEKKWFKWVSRSFTVIWLFMGCLSFYFSEGGIVSSGSEGYWITVIWSIGMIPMIFIVGLITYPSQGDSRGGSGSNKSSMSKRRVIWERIEFIMRVIAIIFCVSLFVGFCGAMGLKMGGPIAAAIAGFSALAIMVTGIVVIFKQHKEASEVEKKNKAKAAKLFRKAAEQGHVSAQSNLGVMYENGEGVPEDKAEATKWIRKAAEQGNEDAKAWLGINTKENRE